MRYKIFISNKLRFILAIFIALASCSMARASAEGSDLEIGRAGEGNGAFGHLCDFAFDGRNNLYVLDGMWRDEQAKKITGNGLVQVFDEKGKFVRQFSIRNEKLGDKEETQRIAVDKSGRVYITYPKADLVAQYGTDGKLEKEHTISKAFGITTVTNNGKEKIAVIGNLKEVVNGKWTWVAGDTFHFIENGTLSTEPVKLSQTLTEVEDLASDASGNLYVLAAVHQVYKFDPTGKLLLTIGSGTETRAEDGSELLHTVAVDSNGSIFSMTFGNPGKVAKIDAGVTTVLTREGQFKWADPWSIHSRYTPLAIDRNDRLWAGAVGAHDPKGVNFKHYNPRPAVVRAEARYFDPTTRGVMEKSALLLGLKPELATTMPYDIAYEPGPVKMVFTIKPGNRRVEKITVNWQVHDAYKTDAGHGTFEMPLTNGVEAKQEFTFSTPKFGWYTVSTQIAYNGKVLRTIGRHLGVTPKFANRPVLDPGDSKGGWEDPARQMFCGLPNERLHAKKGVKELEASLAASAKFGTTVFVQFTDDRKEFTPEKIRAVVTQFKGRVKYWELFNEPNFTWNPQDFAKAAKEAYKIIKEIDPQAQVMGPSVCGMDLGWNEAFFKAGGMEAIDIVATHDYEGHEGIDPNHWRWKLDAFRKLMARYGGEKKEIWQTERAISGVRGGNFQPTTQAVRMLHHRDLLETLGIPSEHNNHYYLNEGGFSGCPSYAWSSTGPHASAIALRNRAAQIGSRKYAGELKFGVLDEKVFMGVCYAGDDGTTIVLRNLGTTDQSLTLAITGGADVEVFDAFGNGGKQGVKAGKLTLSLGQMPTYLKLSKGQDAVPAMPANLGVNFAADATLTYSARHNGDFACLTNGIMETCHAGHPHGGTGPTPIWQADLPAFPQTLELAFPQARPIAAVGLFGVPGDNAFCALLDYDLQYQASGQWKTLAEVRSNVPVSDPVETSLCTATTWYQNTQFHVNRFAPITTDRLRVVVLRTTFGFAPDDVANAAMKNAWGGTNSAKFMLKEIEVYGPATTLQVDLTASEGARNAIPASEKTTLTIENSGKSAANGTAWIVAPTGWTAKPAELPVKLAAGEKCSAEVELIPPAELTDATARTFVQVDGANGTVLGLGRLSIAIAPPVEMRVEPPVPNGAGTTLAISLKNLRAQAVGGKAILTLSGRAAPLTVDVAPIEPNQTAKVEFKVPDLKLGSVACTANYVAAIDRMQVRAEQNLAVRVWNILGPFPRDFEKDYGPEAKLDLAAVYTDNVGTKKSWRTVLSAENGLVNFLPCFQPNNNVCAYASLFVKSPKAQSVKLSVGSDDGVKAWLNGKQLIANDASRGASPRQDEAAGELKAGWNEVLLKITQGDGGWGFFCEFLGNDGKELPGLVFSTSRD